MSLPQYSNASSPNFELWSKQQQQRHVDENHTRCCYYYKQSMNRAATVPALPMPTSDLCCEQLDCTAFEHCAKCQSESTLLLQTLLHERLTLRLSDGRLVEGELECIDSAGSMLLKDVTQTKDMRRPDDAESDQTEPLVVKLQSILVLQQHIVECRLEAEEQLAQLLAQHQCPIEHQ